MKNITPEYIKKAASVVPSERQLKWHELEFYAFIHFGMNTMTGLEWGSGKTSPEKFNPTGLSALQWAESIKKAGMKAIILTAKHHDGFCLWPSRYTEYSVKNSPWKDGKGDVVKETAKACRETGLKFGIYLSPWDRNNESYGRGKEYDDYFVNQLTELLTGYGDIFSVWFDGACGEGKNGKKQVYDWERYYEVIRKYQKDAVINICGPDIRWCGNEAGKCRAAEWNVVPSFYAVQERIAENSQKTADVPPDNIDYALEDIGGREAIKGYNNLIWYPAEVDVSIRKGWFYHKIEDVTVKSPEKLMSIYLNSVGANASLLLNIPPDKRGLIADADIKSLSAFGEMLEDMFRENYGENAVVSDSVHLDSEHKGIKAFTSDKEEFWHSGDFSGTAEITADLKEEKEISRVVLSEHIRTGQQIEKFSLYVKNQGEFEKVYEGQVIGSKKIAVFRKTKARYVKFVLEEARCFGTLSKFEIY